MTTTLDPRLHAFRPDLADVRLIDHVNARNFAQGTLMRVGVPVADLLAEPRSQSGMQSQLLLGDEVTIFENAGGWYWLQAMRDGYVGYAIESALKPTDAELTHRVCVPRTFLYSGADLRFPRRSELSLGSRVTIVGEAVTRGTRYALLQDGTAIIARHILPLGQSSADIVAMAETLLQTPYLWGGTSGFGIDCSGLVQLSMFMTGRNVQRDTDQQSKTIGTVVTAEPDYRNLKRGDLLFWKGHVAIVYNDTFFYDERILIHANGHTMSVALELMHDVITRAGTPTLIRRP